MNCTFKEGGQIILKTNLEEKIKNKFKNKKNNKKISKIKNELSPSYIKNTNPKIFEIDETYYSSLLIVNYYREQSDLLLKRIIDSNINTNISIFYEKQDSYKIINKLTYHIGNVGTDVHSLSENRKDAELEESTYDDAKYIRKEMQVNNDELYYLYIYITVYSERLEEIEYLLNKIEGIMQSNGTQTRRAYFRQEQAFLSTLPLTINNEDLKKATRRNVLTNGLIITYPFISSSIFDEKGIFIGTNIINKSLIFIDKYDTEKYKNANMCIFGTSGAGKSYFLKLNILRYRLFQIDQYIIDSEREYIDLCKKLEGSLIKIGPTSSTFINVLDIREESIEDGRGYLATKISRLIGFFNLIFGELNEREKAILEEKLIILYERKGITFEDETLFRYSKELKKEFKKSEDMPILEDLYNLFDEELETENFKIKLIPFVKGSLSFFNKHTNIELDNKLIVADIYDLGEENFKYGMYLFTEVFWDKIKSDRSKKKAIYIDEIWRLIGVTSNREVAEFIYKIFKTIRKYGGSAVAATQDISDLFSLDEGVFGKSILNNSSIKAFFSLEEENINILKKYTNISDKEKIDIKSLKKGEALMIVGEDHILAKIESAEFEKNIIEKNKEEK